MIAGSVVDRLRLDWYNAKHSTMEAISRQLSGSRGTRRTAQSGADPEREGFAGVLVFLFAVRWGAWAIAVVIVALGGLPDDNVRYEPLLLGLAFIQNLVATLYVPLIRPRVHGVIGRRWGPNDDLIALAVLDMALVIAVLYFSGGWRSPYYHYAVSSLLVPTFLFGWRRSGLLMLAFVGAYLGTLFTAGDGTDGPWLREDRGNLTGVLVTPLMVVVVMQYLSSLTRSLADQREQARRAFRETSALYNIAQTIAASDDPDQLIVEVVATLQGMERFSALTVYSLSGGDELVRKAGFGDEAAATSGRRLSPADGQALAQPEGLIELRSADESAGGWAVPVHLQDRLWGALAFASWDEPSEPEATDLRLMQAVSRQLSLGLTKIALDHQKEELAALEERGRIAREIHDGIAQSIYMLSLNLEKAAEVASGDAKLSQRLGHLVGLAKETLLEVRHYIFDLKPLLEGDATLTGTIRSQIREFTAVSGLTVELEVEGEERALPMAVSGSLYRIAQEALANVYRHANASTVDVRLAFSERSVSLEISDNGSGFAVEGAEDGSAGGRGLRNMRQRTSELGAEVSISSAPGRGTTVRVVVPVVD